MRCVWRIWTSIWCWATLESSWRSALCQPPTAPRLVYVLVSGGRLEDGFLERVGYTTW